MVFKSLSSDTVSGGGENATWRYLKYDVRYIFYAIERSVIG